MSGLVPLDDLAGRINAEHDAAHAAARSAIEHAVECGRLLIEAKAQVAHGQWLPWVDRHLTFGARQAQNFMRVAEHAETLLEANAQSTAHLTIDGALRLLAAPREGAPDPLHTLRIMGSSASQEWYTPVPLVERVVATLGEVDLDPSWHPESPVRARAAHTAADDGLAQRWAGRVYLNPPYGRDIAPWIAKLVAEYDAGSVSEAVALVPARVDTDWFRLLDRFPRCFVYGRLTFANSDYPAPFPSAVVYLGPNVERFVAAFAPVGGIFVRIEDATFGRPSP